MSLNAKIREIVEEDVNWGTGTVPVETIDGIKQGEQVNASHIPVKDATLQTKGSNVEEVLLSIDSDIPDLTDIENRISQNETDITNLENVDVNLQNQITSNDTDILDLQNRVSTNETDISNLETEDITLQNQITSNDTDILDLQNRVSINETDIDDLQNQIDNHIYYDNALRVKLTDYRVGSSPLDPSTGEFTVGILSDSSLEVKISTTDIDGMVIINDQTSLLRLATGGRMLLRVEDKTDGDSLITFEINADASQQDGYYLYTATAGSYNLQGDLTTLTGLQKSFSILVAAVGGNTGGNAGSANTVKVSSTDGYDDYLYNKIEGGFGITTELNDSTSDQKVTILNDLVDENEHLYLEPETEPNDLQQGNIYYDIDEDLFNFAVQDGTTIALGEISPLGRNNTGSIIEDYTPVMLTGALGASGKVTIGPFIADGTYASSYYVGITTQSIGINKSGHVTFEGKVSMPTTGALYGETWSEGNLLYVHQSEARLTNVQPTSGQSIPTAIVINAHAINGEIYVRKSYEDFQNTDTIELDNTSIESLSGTVQFQNEANEEFTTAINQNTSDISDLQAQTWTILRYKLIAGTSVPGNGEIYYDSTLDAFNISKYTPEGSFNVLLEGMGDGSKFSMADITNSSIQLYGTVASYVDNGTYVSFTLTDNGGSEYITGDYTTYIEFSSVGGSDVTVDVLSGYSLTFDPTYQSASATQNIITCDGTWQELDLNDGLAGSFLNQYTIGSNLSGTNTSGGSWHITNDDTSSMEVEVNFSVSIGLEDSLTSVTGNWYQFYVGLITASGDVLAVDMYDKNVANWNTANSVTTLSGTGVFTLPAGEEIYLAALPTGADGDVYYVDILSQSISVSEIGTQVTGSVGAEYTAGDGIDITDNVISSTAVSNKNALNFKYEDSYLDTTDNYVSFNIVEPSDLSFSLNTAGSVNSIVKFYSYYYAAFGSSVYYSTDEGTTWSFLFNIGSNILCMNDVWSSEENSGILIFGCSNGYHYGLPDTGNNNLLDYVNLVSNTSITNVNYLVEFNIGETYTIGLISNYNLYYTSTDGVNFILNADYSSVGTNFNCVTFISNSNTVVFGTDAGVYLSWNTDGTGAYLAWSGSTNINDFYRVNNSELDRYYLISNSGLYYENSGWVNGGSWQQINSVTNITSIAELDTGTLVLGTYNSLTYFVDYYGINLANTANGNANSIYISDELILAGTNTGIYTSDIERYDMYVSYYTFDDLYVKDSLSTGLNIIAKKEVPYYKLDTIKSITNDVLTNVSKVSFKNISVINEATQEDVLNFEIISCDIETKDIQITSFGERLADSTATDLSTVLSDLTNNYEITRTFAYNLHYTSAIYIMNENNDIPTEWDPITQSGDIGDFNILWNATDNVYNVVMNKFNQYSVKVNIFDTLINDSSIMIQNKVSGYYISGLIDNLVDNGHYVTFDIYHTDGSYDLVTQQIEGVRDGEQIFIEFINANNNEVIKFLVYNGTGSDIPALKPIRVDGTHDIGIISYPAIDVANASSTNPEESKGVALTLDAIPNGQLGYVARTGIYRNLDTSSLTLNNVYYLSTIDYNITSVEPTYPNYSVKLFKCLSVDSTDGIIDIDVDSVGGQYKEGTSSTASFLNTMPIAAANAGVAVFSGEPFRWSATATMCAPNDIVNIDVNQSKLRVFVKQNTGSVIFAIYKKNELNNDLTLVANTDVEEVLGSGWNEFTITNVVDQFSSNDILYFTILTDLNGMQVIGVSHDNFNATPYVTGYQANLGDVETNGIPSTISFDGEVGSNIFMELLK